jgi:hypothetical protein
MFGFAFKGIATFPSALSFSTGATSICICHVVVSPVTQCVADGRMSVLGAAMCLVHASYHSCYSMSTTADGVGQRCQGYNECCQNSKKSRLSN